jgi:hypothetical protein
MKRACHDADEYDAFTKWRRMYNWRPGDLRRIKRQASKRDRRRARAEIRSGRDS